MQYRFFGNTDIKLSLIGLGTMTWGEQNSAAEAEEQMDFAWEKGVNFFDVAEMYPVPPKPETCGASESILGAWLKKKAVRDQLFLATKVTGRSERNSGIGHLRNGARLTREHIFEAIDGSLARLQTDYVDLYQVHWPERRTNFFGQLGYQHADDDGVELAETLAALAELVDAGKVRYVGISNETPWGMLAYLRLHWQQSLPRIQSIQNPYNLLNRTFEVGCAEIAEREKVGLLAYSPLAFGALTGKYLRGQKPVGARLTLFERFQRYNKVNCETAIEAYCNLAKECNLSPAQLALAFVNQQSFLTSNIIGATSIAQLRENIDSLNVQLNAATIEKIHQIHSQYPNPAP